MITSAPHYLLFSEARTGVHSRVADAPGEWRFVLESADGETLLDVQDEESEDRDRLELLAVVRGLEAIDHPSRVTLISNSRYVSNGLRRGLPEWRDNGWVWERFGELVPVTNSDLWQRVDHALKFHRVHCRTWRFDEAHREVEHSPHVSTRHRMHRRRPGTMRADTLASNRGVHGWELWRRANWWPARLRRLLQAFCLRLRLWWSATLLTGTGV